MNGVLAEALADPLVEGPLELVTPVAKDRSLSTNISGLKVTDLPLISIGRPRAWTLSHLFGDQPLLPTVRTRLDREIFFVARLACSFRPQKDEIRILWARFVADLLPDDFGNQPLAFDLYPRSVERERQASKKVTLNPSLKFMEIEASVGEFGYSVDYSEVDPVVSAAGFEEASPSWDFTSAPGYKIHGGKLLHAIIAAPQNLQRLTMCLGMTADIEYQGVRLPAWLGGGADSVERRTSVTVWP